MEPEEPFARQWRPGRDADGELFHPHVNFVLSMFVITFFSMLSLSLCLLLSAVVMVSVVVFAYCAEPAREICSSMFVVTFLDVVVGLCAC